MGQYDSAAEIEAAALTWVARLDRARDPDELHLELAGWLANDPRRKGAFLRAQAIWVKIDRAALAESHANLPARQTRRWAMAGGGAGLLAASSVGAWFALVGRPVNTAQGEVRHIPLPDGSSLDLNTDSQIEVGMGRKHRGVQLHRGEAWFQVEKNPQRPFVVEAGRARIMAVGTAFSVRRFDLAVEVLVTEGVVLAWLLGREAQAVRLEAGDKGRLDPDGTHRLVSAAAEIDRRLAWRVGKIDLADETLEDAVSEFNRYNRRKLRIKGSAVASRRLYGVFRIDDPEGFATSVHYALGIPVEPQDDQIVIG